MNSKNQKKVRTRKDFNPLFSVLDIVVTTLSYFFAYFLINLIDTRYFKFYQEYVIMLFLIVPTWAILLQILKLTKIPRTHSNVSIFFNFLNFSSIGFALIFLYKHIFNLENFSHYFIISFSRRRSRNFRRFSFDNFCCIFNNSLKFTGFLAFL